MGKHNVLNAAAAVTVCINLGVNQNVIKGSLKKFSGVQRRMTKIFSKKNNDFYDDYAHHPTEISSILESVKNVYKNRKIISVFEPHRYSRIISLKKILLLLSKNLIWYSFAQYMPLERKKIPDTIITNLQKLISKFSNTQVIIIENFKDLETYFKKNLMSNEIIIGMGAGLISKFMRELKVVL